MITAITIALLQKTADLDGRVRGISAILYIFSILVSIMLDIRLVMWRGW